MSNLKIQSIYSLISSNQTQQQQSRIKLTTPLQKVKQIVEKGMEIAPWFKKHQLMRVFKECYENESLFINKLNNIQVVEEGDEGWIVQGEKRGKKKEDREEGKGEYSFLKDDKLMKRVGGKGEQYIQGEYHKRNEKRHNKDNYGKEYQNTKYEQRAEQKRSRKYIEKKQFIDKNKDSSEQPSYLSNQSNIEAKKKQHQQPISDPQPIDPLIAQIFNNICTENPYILPFITPIDKTQRIQYIIDNKNISNVKVRIITQI